MGTSGWCEGAGLKGRGCRLTLCAFAPFHPTAAHRNRADGPAERSQALDRSAGSLAAASEGQYRRRIGGGRPAGAQARDNPDIDRSAGRFPFRCCRRCRRRRRRPQEPRHGAAVGQTRGAIASEGSQATVSSGSSGGAEGGGGESPSRHGLMVPGPPRLGPEPGDSSAVSWQLIKHLYSSSTSRRRTTVTDRRTEFRWLPPGA